MFNRLTIMFFCVVITATVGGCGGGSGKGGNNGSSGSSSSQAASVGSGSSSGSNVSGGGSKTASTTSSSPSPSSASGGSNLSSVLGSTAHYITDVRVQNYGQGTASGAVDVTFGQVFADGDVGSSQHVVAVANGQALPTQVDRKATWSDGALRHGVITVQFAKPGSGSAQTLKLYAASGPVNLGLSTVSLSDLLGTNFNAQIQIKLNNGTTYTANARNALQQATQSRCPAWGNPSCKRWLAGGLASEWVVAAKLKSGTATAPRLRVFFNVRAYRGAGGGIANVRVDSVIENDQAYDVSPSDETYDATISVGSSNYSATGITHYIHARWHHVLWTRGNPTIFVQPDVAYLQKSRAISKYADVTPTSGLLNGVAQSAQPMSNVDQTPHMGNTGAQAAIGPLPRWTSTFVVSGDRRAFNWMLANDDGVGSYGFHYRDDATGRPLTITDHPYVTIAAIRYARTASKGGYRTDLLPACGGDCSTPFSYDIAHQPSIGYVPYLVTGDFYYLEEMQFEASYDELWANPAYRKYDKGRLIHAQRQVRGQAWALRSIADAAFATPDADPMKHYFTDQVDRNINDYVKTYVDHPADHSLHVLDGGGAIIYPLHGATRVGISPWQQDFFTWAVGHAAEQGVPQAETLLRWMAKFQVGLMTSASEGATSGFCWLQASGYAFQVRDAKGSPEYSSLDRVYKTTYPTLAGLACDSQEMVNAMSTPSHQYKIGEMQGYAWSPTGFPSNLQIGLAAAANSGINKASQAWSVFANRSVKPDYSNDPNFALVPR